MTPQEEATMAAELLITGVEVESDEDDVAADLHELLAKDQDESPDVVIVKLLRVLANAATGAADVHVDLDQDEAGVGTGVDTRLRAVAQHIEAAARLLDPSKV